MIGALDAVEHIGTCFSLRPVYLAPGPFSFHRRKEAPHGSVVPTLTMATHAAGSALFKSQDLSFTILGPSLQSPVPMKAMFLAARR